ncbi:MAG: MFS transporter [Desulfobacterales bacterium]|nr:MFS transporter [Desulfobacterales bacterium]
MFYGWVIVAASFLMSVIGMGTRYSFGVFLKSIQIEFGMTRGATSGIFSVYMLLCCVSSIAGGWVIDKYGPRKICISFGALTALSLILTGLVHRPWQLLITYSLLLSLGTGAIYPVVNTTVSRWFVARRGYAVGLTSSGGGVGAIVLAPFSAYLITLFDWRMAFLILGLVSGGIILAAALPLKKDPAEMGLFPDGAVPAASAGTYPANSPAAHASGLSLSQAAGTSQFWLLGCVWFFLALSLHMIIVHVVSYALDQGIEPLDAAFILSLIGLANICGRLVIGKMSDSLGRKPLAVTCALLQFGSLLWLMWAHSLWALYAFAVAFGFLWGGFATITTTLIGDTFGTRQLGIIMGVLTSLWALGAAAGPAVGGYLFDLQGNYFAAFAAGAAGLLAAAAFTALVRRLPDAGHG